MAEFARQWGLNPATVRMHMYRGVCRWPQRHNGINQCNHPLYQCWVDIIQRCTNSKNHSYKNYGGRGITVDIRWQADFYQFVKDMGDKPTSQYSIDRMDNSKGYYPDNCRWATMRDQALNRRNTVSTPNIEQSKTGVFRGYFTVCGKTVHTPSFEFIEEAQAHLETLKQLYKEYL